MTLSFLYKFYLRRMQHFLAKSDTTEDWVVRDDLKSLAHDCQRRATELAHCIAVYGDQNVREMNVIALRESIESIRWAIGAPIYHGLNFAHEAMKREDDFY